MSKPIRVSMIIQAFYPHVGGAERQLAALAPLLKINGVEIDILTRRYAGLASFEYLNDVPVHRLPIPGPKPINSTVFMLAAMPLLRRLQPDIIHAHELLSPTATAVTAKRLFGTPVVAKVLRGGSLGDIEKLKRNRVSARRINSYRKTVDRFIAISSEIDTELAEAGIPAGRRVFIPNGVDVKRFVSLSGSEKKDRRAALGLPHHVPIVVFTGRLSPEKRINYLVDMWPSIRLEHPGAMLLIIGTGPEAQALRQAAGEGVLFAGKVENVVPYLQAADLFVLPSSTEGLSNALLEALAVGLACVATAVGGAPDVVEHGRTGWLIPPEKPDLLKNGILTLLNNSRLRLEMGQLGRNKIVRDYALSTTAARLRRLYDELLSGKTSEAGSNRSATMVNQESKVIK